MVICQRSVPVVWGLVSKVVVGDEGLLYLEARREHASGYYQIGDNEAGHAEGEKNGLASV